MWPRSTACCCPPAFPMDQNTSGSFLITVRAVVPLHIWWYFPWAWNHGALFLTCASSLRIKTLQPNRSWQLCHQVLSKAGYQLFLAIYLPFSERKTSIDKISSCDQRATEKWCEDDAFILSDLFWIYLPPRKSLCNQDEGLLQRFCQAQDILISLCWFLPLATGSQGWVSVKWRVAGSQIQ